MKRFVVMALICCMGSGAAFAGPIEDRQALMKSIASTTMAANRYARFEMAFDAQKVRELLQVYVDGAAQIPGLFPDDSRAGEDPTTAAPKIWEDKADFEARAAKPGRDATAAMNATDPASFAQAFAVVTDGCSTCHELYRIRRK